MSHLDRQYRSHSTIQQPPIARILIVDDHPTLRRGLAELISHEPDLGICGEADDAATAFEQIKSTDPDLVIMDIALRDCNGLDLVKELKSRDPSLRVLVCSMHDDSLFAERSLRAGALGYLNKDQAIAEVVDAVRRVLRGSIYLSPPMAERFMHRTRQVDGRFSNPNIDQLSNRELEVFELIGRGLETGEIAQRLNLSPQTILDLRRRIRSHLGLCTSEELVQLAVRWLLDEPESRRDKN